MLAVTMTMTVVVQPLEAGSPTELEKNPPVTFASPAHPWSFSAGVSVRSIDADFHLSAPALNWHGLAPQRRGLGDIGLFSGGGIKRYDNGSVGPDFDILSGESEGGVFALGQGGNIHSEGRTVAFIGNVPLSTFDYYSHSYSYSSSLQSNSVDVNSSDVGVGPYLEFSRRVIDGPSLIVDAFVGWSYVETSHSSGNRTVARQSIIERDVLHTYAYEGVGIADPSGSIAIPGFPNVTGVLLYDRQLLDSFSLFPLGIRGPRQTDRATSRVIASFYAVSGGSLDVHLNEIPFGVKVGRKFGDLTVLAELGGLLAVIDYDLSAETRWYRSSGSLVSRQSWRDSDDDVKMGVFTGVTLQHDLSKDGRWFAEAHGTYRWVDAAHATAGPVRVKIDVSSWEGGLGLGYRF
jgi:hypothetical protein